MKRKNILCAAGLAVMLLSGCAGQESKLTYIGASKAKSVALEAAGISAPQANFTSVDMLQRGEQDYYRVEFTAQDEEYAYDIDALTGVVIASDSGETAAEGMDAPDEGTIADNGNTVSGVGVPDEGAIADNGNTVSGVSVPDDSAGAAEGAGTVMLSEKEAQVRALAYAGLTSGQAAFIKSDLDADDGRQFYEVEFYTEDGKEYDYEIDAFTGEVISFDHEAEDITPPAPGDSKISAEKAKELALAQVPGASERDIFEFGTDHDDGRIEYEGKIIYDGMEYEIGRAHV